MHTIRELPDGTIEIDIDDKLWQEQELEAASAKADWDELMRGVPDDPDAIMARLLRAAADSLSKEDE